nr:FAD/NAD(P)-binding protein [Amylibacter sp.]
MTATTTAIRIAIIGAGPRGLGALESLVTALLGRKASLELTTFDDLQLAGAGPNFDPSQTPHCILNIPMREVDISPTLPLPCGDFSDWQKQNGFTDADRFPTRAELGAYLMARFRDVTETDGLAIRLTAHKTKATRLLRKNGAWHVATATSSFGPFDEILLIPGQPQTPPDDQWAAWQKHANTGKASTINAYPDRQLLDAAQDWTGKNIGIRGLGLSTFDVLRVLTIGLGGRFEDGSYLRSGAEPARIFAFSLNGQPPFPKPVDAALDARFDLNTQEIDRFQSAVEKATQLAPKAALETICAALGQATLRIGTEMGAGWDRADVSAWFATERRSPGDQETLDPAQTLKSGIQMALGATPPSVGYSIGQIWRKLQNQLRASFNSAQIEPDTAQAIVGFDEGLKRYSYGPPLRSAQELLALLDCKLVSLCVVDDPDIKCIPDGWHLQEDDAEAKVSVMIDAVLAPPKLAAISDPLLVQMKSDGVIQDFYDGSGAQTCADGQLVGTDGVPQTGLSLLGRLALGSVIAADSIHDCFGASSDRWAKGVLERGIK